MFENWTARRWIAASLLISIIAVAFVALVTILFRIPQVLPDQQTLLPLETPIPPSSAQVTGFVLIDQSQTVLPLSMGDTINRRAYRDGATLRVLTSSDADDLQVTIRDVDANTQQTVTPDNGLFTLDDWLQSASTLEISAISSQDHSQGRSIQLAVVDYPLSDAPTYYIDARSGDDAASGLSPGQAWQTIQPLQDRVLAAGTHILLRRDTQLGSDDTWVLDASGTSAHPIVIGAYGSGEAPVIRNTTIETLTHALVIRGNDVIVRDVRIDGATERGIWIIGDRVQVLHTTITNTGSGVWVDGNRARLLNNIIHDLHMIVNDPQPDNDYGAQAIVVAGGEGTMIADNRFYNLLQPSMDYGTDGSALEIFSEMPIRNLIFTRNQIATCDNAIELGSGNAVPAENIMVHHNIIDTCNGAVVLHVSGGDTQWGAALSGFAFDHNTVIDAPVFWVSTAAEAYDISVRNNIFALSRDTLFFSTDGVTRSGNLYSAPYVRAFPFTLMDNERLLDPIFINPAQGDYRVSMMSPVVSLSDAAYQRDLNGRLIPDSDATRAGALHLNQVASS